MFLLFISADRVATGEETPMAYEVLQQFDFPIGHLPKGATGYELNNWTGDSKAYLGEGTCSFSLEGLYNLKYKSTIKGETERGWAGVFGGVFVGEFQDGEFLGLPAVWLRIEAAVGLEAMAEGGGERAKEMKVKTVVGLERVC
ncbi:hypothetical protein RHMOL_Rhmol07G0321600 [Rhododendron molle]|uniref:Uncharacterized protein n=1 Tax=Rhododendron molle TaxID=49168 RepID=A0ACC0N7A2_RHOML|nr:hypothetical protein RHMOL_Rhmol07G0321600 [Rhododendron molle]